ncbi:hypothetical protein IAR55_002327 [Kwoniella newhampshirensis]|uniref:DNA replication regulator SLD2 n=1 Tax=Kwoniella newhampshirensis TaxID=1651941 RepID=A0AAW0Z0X0_9TREE
MDIASVKATVKSWEKAFKARHGRDPTKEDIKSDPFDIADQYALYRRLTKSASSSSSQSQMQSQARKQSQAGPSSQSTSLSVRSRSTTTSTPRTIPSSEYPTTPTPPARRASGFFRAALGRVPGASSSTAALDADEPSRSDGLQLPANSQIGGGAIALKRKASRAGLNHDSSPPRPPPSLPVPTARTLFTTPKKKRAYSGPVHDPNPFTTTTTITPMKPAPLSPFKRPSTTATPKDEADQISTGPLGAFRSGAGNNVKSPFIHASSPRKLKAVLEANSLRKVRERDSGSEITPRTRARKRLRGEQVADTPLKEKDKERNGWRRRRSVGGRSSEETPDELEFGGSDEIGGLVGKGSGFPFASDDEDGEEEKEEEEEEEEKEEGDELGPSPMKGVRGEGKRFTSLFGEVETESKVTTKTSTSFATKKSTSVQTKLMMEILEDDVKREADTVRSKGVEKGKGRNKGKESKRGRPSEMMGLFGRVGRQKERIRESGGSPEDGPVHTVVGVDILPIVPSPPLPTRIMSDENTAQAGPSTPPQSRRRSDSPLPTPPPDPLLEEAASFNLTPSSRTRRRDKVLSISDDEEDEWDPEGGRIVRKVVIVPTRRVVRWRRDSDDLDVGSGSRSESSQIDEEEEEEVEEEGEDGSPSITREGTTHSSILPSSPTHPPSQIPLLHLLSIRSPPPSAISKRSTGGRMAKAKLDELRVKAIFNPFDAARLKALERGQEVVFSGEGGENEGRDEEDLLEKYQLGQGKDDQGEIGGDGDGIDDDWESESEGWKRTEGVMDDDEPW